MRRSWVTAVVGAVALTATLLTPGAVARDAAAAERSSAGCDPLVRQSAADSSCLLPFPSNWHTTPDSSTDTGLRVDFDPAVMPRNSKGDGIDPAEWNRNDGFSPGSMIMGHVPGLDLEKTGAAPLTDIGSSLAEDAPIVLLNLDTGQRHPYWAELDANATDPDRQALIVRPAENLHEGHRYAVALRDLKDADGNPIEPTPAFAAVAAGTPGGDAELRRRADQLAPALKGLAKAGVRTDELHLAWDFTVASERGLTERLLHLRDDSFARLGDDAPEHLVYEVTERPEDDPIARSIRGVYNIPSYLDQPGGPPGSRFHYGADGLPAVQDGNQQVAAFQCEIPRSALSEPALPALYGHGLLGSDTSVGGGATRALAAEQNIVLCATKWAGMSEDDLANVAGTLEDLSRFPSVADRLQQGILNAQWLGRLLTHEQGLGADPAFRTTDGKPVLDTSKDLGFYGVSQGGILGGALTAVSTEVKRSALSVPAMNFSTLLNRSNLWSPFQAIIDVSYPDRMEQQINLALIQMLWDRGEGNGYAHHMTDHPLPGTPSHQVLMHVAFGDHQVSPTAAEVQARTIGARIHQPSVADGRNPDAVPYWGIAPLDYGAGGRTPGAGGSGIVIWDSGSPYQPITNTPPTTGHDPHSDPHNSPLAREQVGTFLRTGRIVDVCGGAPCEAAPVGG